MTTRKANPVKKAVRKTALKKPVGNGSAAVLLSRAEPSTSALNYYGSNTKARNEAYAKVMAFIASNQKSNAGG
jgi:hypothetical protein